MATVRNDHLEIAVISLGEIALDRRTRTGNIDRHTLTLSPRRRNVLVVPEVVPEISTPGSVANGRNDLEVAVISIREIALNQPTCTGHASSLESWVIIVRQGPPPSRRPA